MQKLIAYPLTVIHLLVFFVMLLIFHPIQVFCHNVLGYDAHRKSVYILNWFLMKSQLFLGTTYAMDFTVDLPVGPSYIFVANHQSMFDIPPLIYHLRHYHPKFIAKKELDRGIPSISYNLRVGENCSIDRKDPKQALIALMSFAKNVHSKKRSAMIFAEGTRSRTGVPKAFQPRGLKTLFKYIPEAVVVPISINNSWKVDRYGKFPYGVFNNIQLTVHSPIPIANRDHEEVILEAQRAVHNGINEKALL